MARKTKLRRAKPTLEWCVVGTLAWFAILKRPLSLPELSRLLLKQKANQRQIHAVLETLGDRVVERDGRYTLRGTSVRWPTEESDRWYRYKWWRARLAVRAIRWIPYLRMVALTQTVADKTARKGSDIDFFIVTEHGRLYLARLLVTAMLHMTGLRRHGQKVANRVCLLFYVTEASLDLRPILFDPYDIYVAYWVAETTPLLDNGRVFEDFKQANQWVAEYVPHYYEGGGQPVKPTWASRFFERVFNTYLGDLLENRLASWQQARIRANQERKDPDVLIVATDRMLKFHEKERRKVYRTEWERLMRKLGYDPALILK